MKVGIIAYGLNRPIGGISRYTRDLIHALSTERYGAAITVVPLATSRNGDPPSTARPKSHHLVGCRLLPGLLTMGNLAIPLAARTLGLDIVHDPTGVSPLLLTIGRSGTVVTVHDVFAWSSPGNSTFLDTIIYRHWLPKLLPKVDAIITVSHTSKADIVRFLNISADKVRVVYEGVNRELHPIKRADIVATNLHRRLPDNYILFVGSVERRKNLHGLLQAYALLRRRGERRPVVVVGARRRRYSEIARTMERLDLGQEVIFTGHLPDADLSALYSGADLFVFPSFYEGYGLPPLEAMACGAPVVCSNAASLPEVVGEAAIMVDPRDVEGLAEAMSRVLADRDLQEEMRARGLARARRFTWERAARETLAVYDEVLA